ncbi:hypothetical protein [Streptomyces platensis]|uniref:hypothetical protein n=1 Tax=Streptomyces platensis TaxID=58346 RepID=UPI00386E99DC|nr:hypothetical protein OG962_01635 [Streptomyces platensis]
MAQAFHTLLAALNSWRAEYGVPELEQLRYVPADQWNRFYLPFARAYLDRARLLRVTAFQACQSYLSITDPFEVTHQTEPITSTLHELDLDGHARLLEGLGGRQLLFDMAEIWPAMPVPRAPPSGEGGRTGTASMEYPLVCQPL